MASDIAVNISLGATLASSFSGSLTAAQTQVRGLAASLRQAERSNVGQTSGRREAIRGLSADLRTAQTDLATLRDRARASGGASGYLARQIAQTEQRVNSLTSRLRTQSTGYRDLIARMRAAGESTHGLRERQARLAEQMARVRTSQARLSGNLAARQAERDRRGDIRGRVLETAATAATVAIPVKLAISAEDTFADLKKVLPNMDDAGVQQIFDDALAMSAKTGKSIEDVLAIMTAGAQAGLGKTRDEMLGVTEQALQMSVAWGVPAEEAGKSLATWQASMKLTAADSKKLADTINVLSDAMNAEAGEINEITTRMGPMLKGMGFGTAGIAAYSAAVKAAGADVDVAGTALKNMNAVMVAGEGGLTKDQKGIYARLKIDPDVLAKQMTEDAEGATLMVLEALNTLPQHEKMSLAMRLFGKESIAAIAPLLGNLDLLKGSLELAQGAVDGSVFKEYQNRMSTAASAGDRLTQNVRGLGIEIGSVLLPAVKEGFAWLDSFTTTVRGLAKDCPGLTKAVMYGASALAGLAVAGLVGSYVFSGLKSVWLAGRGALLLFSAAQATCGLSSGILVGGIKAVKTAFMVATGPVGLFIGVVGLAAGLIIDNWDTVGPYFKDMWDGVVGIFQGAWDTISGIIDMVSNGMSWLGEQIDEVPVLGSAKRGIGKAWDWAVGNEETEAPADSKTPADPKAPVKSPAVEAAQKNLDAGRARDRIAAQSLPAARSLPAAQADPQAPSVVPGDSFGYTPFPEEMRDGFWNSIWNGTKSLFSSDGATDVTVPIQRGAPVISPPVSASPAVEASRAAIASPAVEASRAAIASPAVDTSRAAIASPAVDTSRAAIASRNWDAAAYAGPQTVLSALPAFSGREPVGLATHPEDVRQPQSPEAVRTAEARSARKPSQSGKTSRASDVAGTAGAAGVNTTTITVPMTFNVQGLDPATFKQRIEDCRADFEGIVRRVVGDMERTKARTAYVPG